ncbi:MAG: cellulase family glycosylhydrolase [bacterium]|nr:cellulase family glycosylhydrolase [bacterium]
MIIKKSLKIILKILFATAILVAVFFAAMFIFNKPAHPDLTIGASFDPDYARYLGVDPAKNLEKILGDWNFRYLRFSAHWDGIEAVRGQYNWSSLDWQMEMARAQGAKIIIAIGHKTPRWPECHLPVWAQSLPAADYAVALNDYIKATVNRYKNNPALEIWQVENEPLLAYGLCMPLTSDQLEAEIAMVKELDPAHPTLTTDSGELSWWFQTARAADLFGTTMYRVVWDRFIGYWRYSWLAPGYYTFRARINGLTPANTFVVELQTEPWIPGAFSATPLTEQNKSMDETQLKANLAAAEHTGFSRVYLWGAEWWYWLEQQGQNEIPDFIRALAK